MKRMAKLLRVCLMPMMLAAPAVELQAQQSQTRQQYVYVLHLTPRLHDQKSWTEVENGAVARHFARLAKATESGQVILAGRTTEALDKTFGLVIFEAEDAKAAKAFMEADPAVVANVMSATLHPYSIALQRKP
jgi:uncharacterized protein YciI